MELNKIGNDDLSKFEIDIVFLKSLDKLLREKNNNTKLAIIISKARIIKNKFKLPKKIIQQYFIGRVEILSIRSTADTNLNLSLASAEYLPGINIFEINCRLIRDAQKYSTLSEEFKIKRICINNNIANATNIKVTNNWDTRFLEVL